MVCLFATTKYQIINAINITLQSNFDADIYLINENIYDNFAEIAERIKSENIFKNVIQIETAKWGKKFLTPRFSSFIWYCNYFKFVKSFLCREDYCVVYFCTNSITERLTRFYFLKKNTDVNFMMYDEGVASYLGVMEVVNRFPENIIRRLMFGKKSLNTVFDRYLYKPELYYGFNDTARGHIKKIEPIDVKSEQLKIFNRIFCVDEGEQIDEKIIFLGTVPELALKKEAINKYNDIIKMLSNFKNLIIKRHPADKSEKQSGVKYLEYSDKPFEIIMANFDIESKVIISLSSTAAVTSKIIYDKEPVVILLYKLFKGTIVEWNDYYDTFFQNVRKTYRNANRFFIPENMDAFEKILFQYL